MSVRFKTLGIITLTLLALVLILYTSARLILLDTYLDLEAQDAQRNLERALNALADDLATLDRTAGDYAGWDDTYAFVVDHNPDYVATNFLDATFINNRLSLIMIVDLAGEVVYGEAFDLVNEQFIRLPEFWRSLAPQDLLLAHAGEDSRVVGVLRLPGHVMLAASRPILTSAYTGPIRGTLIMGRVLDTAEIARLAESTRLQLEFQTLDDPQLSAEFQALAGATWRVQPLDEQLVAAYGRVDDIYGQPALMAHVTLDRAIYRQGQNSLAYFIAAVLTAGLVFGAVMMILMESMVLSRLARLSREVTEIGARQDFMARVFLPGKDEPALLASEINTMLTALEALNHQIEIEQQKSQNLLLNVLPASIVDRLKHGEVTIADHMEGTVLFADLVDFTEVSARMSPEEVVVLLNAIFSAFDELAEKYQLEKIKTIGDSYMVVGGLPVPRPDHAEAVADIALEMQAVMEQLDAARARSLRLRVGINTGPVVAGVVGTRKFLYDLWGDTVNTASRMESHGLAGGIQVTQATYDRLKDKYEFKERGVVLVKGKGAMVTYLLVGRRPHPAPPYATGGL